MEQIADLRGNPGQGHFSPISQAAGPYLASPGKACLDVVRADRLKLQVRVRFHELSTGSSGSHEAIPNHHHAAQTPTYQHLPQRCESSHQ